MTREPPVASQSKQHGPKRQHGERPGFGYTAGAGDNDVVDREEAAAFLGIPAIEPERDGRGEPCELSAQIHFVLAVVCGVGLIRTQKKLLSGSTAKSVVAGLMRAGRFSANSSRLERTA